MVRIAVLSPRDPVPVYSGLLERVYQLAETLGEKHDVTVLYPDEPTRRNEDGRVPKEQPFDRVGLQSPFIELLDKRIGAYSPARGLYKTHPWLYRPLRKRVTQLRPDYLIVEMPFLLPVALAASRGLNIPVILSEHNIQYKVTERLGIPGTRPLRLFETQMAERVDAVITVSQVDKRTLEGSISTPIRVAPNGVDIDRFTPIAESNQLRTHYGKGPMFMYHGSLGNAQNSEAISRLLDPIFPQLREQYPDAQLLLVGSDPPSVQQTGVYTTGLVDNLAEYVASADVALVPLQSGSGTKLKVLEYLAAGTPVVTTPIGAEGFPLTDRENACIVESDDAFVEAAVALIDDGSLRERLVNQGRKLVEERFSWEQTLQPYEELITTLAKNDT